MTTAIDLFGINDLSDQNVEPMHDKISLFDLRLVTAKIPIKFCEYKISSTVKSMLSCETTAVSENGILFSSTQPFNKGTLLRLWVEIPNYWTLKARRVEYRRSEAPQHFQILARVLKCEETQRTPSVFQMICENVTIDSLDAVILKEYLESITGETTQ